MLIFHMCRFWEEHHHGTFIRSHLILLSGKQSHHWSPQHLLLQRQRYVLEAWYRNNRHLPLSKQGRGQHLCNCLVGSFSQQLDHRGRYLDHLQYRHKDMSHLLDKRLYRQYRLNLVHTHQFVMIPTPQCAPHLLHPWVSNRPIAIDAYKFFKYAMFKQEGYFKMVSNFLNSAS